ncbi:hypothetical protein RyT2_19880 [Pseudolactococcus yaeyamensis]
MTSPAWIKNRFRRLADNKLLVYEISPLPTPEKDRIKGAITIVPMAPKAHH